MQLHFFEDLENIKDIYNTSSQSNYEINEGLYTERNEYSERIYLEDKLLLFSSSFW